jgi:transcriptional regulator with XRE-family HTH domain
MIEAIEPGSFGSRLKRYRTERGLTQSELAGLLGVSQETITNYERNGRFPRPRTLQAIARLFGVSLDGLVGGPEAGSPRPVRIEVAGAAGAAAGGPPDIDPDELISVLRSETPENAYAYLAARGAGAAPSLADAYERTFVPALVRIGELWERGELSVADEHLLSERIRELAFRRAAAEPAAESSPAAGAPPDAGKRRWMGVCAPGEKHELALLFLSLALRRAGWRTWYLGTQVPLPDLLGAIARCEPRVLAVSVTMAENAAGLEPYLGRIRARFGAKPAIVLGGRGLAGSGPELARAVDAVAASISEGLAIAERLVDE